MASLTFKSGKEDKEFFKDLELALQPYFDYNPVAKLGFYAILDGDIFGKALGPQYEGGTNFQVGLEIADPDAFSEQGMSSYSAAYYAPQYIGQRSYDGKIFVKTNLEGKDKVADIQRSFILNAADENSSFLHELTHAGHMVLNTMLREGTSPISELSPKQNPNIIQAVPMGVDPATTENLMFDVMRGVPETGVFGQYQREQFPNEATNIIARLGLDRNDPDGSILTENLVDINTYDAMVKSYINADALANLNVDRTEMELDRLLNPVYNRKLRTTAIPLGSDLSYFKVYDDMGYDPDANPLRPFDYSEVKEFGFYPSDKDYLKMLRRNNELLNQTATKVLNMIEGPPASSRVKTMPEIKEKPSWWQKTVDFLVNKPADAIGGAIDALPFNEGGQVKSLDEQMKELEVG